MECGEVGMKVVLSVLALCIYGAGKCHVKLYITLPKVCITTKVPNEAKLAPVWVD